MAAAFPVGIVLSGGLNVLFDYWKEAFLLGVLPLILSVITLFFLPESEKGEQMQKSDNQIFKNLFSAENQKSLFFGSAIFGSVLVGIWGVFRGYQRGYRAYSVIPLTDKPNEDSQWYCWVSVALWAVACLSGFSPIIYSKMAFLTLFLGISQGALSSYIPALFPVNIRATATGFCFNIARFFTATAVFFVGSLVTFFGGFSNTIKFQNQM